MSKADVTIYKALNINKQLNEICLCICMRICILYAFLFLLKGTIIFEDFKTIFTYMHTYVPKYVYLDTGMFTHAEISSLILSLFC